MIKRGMGSVAEDVEGKLRNRGGRREIRNRCRYRRKEMIKRGMSEDREE